MSHRIEEQELLQRIAELPREIQPHNDPWTSISARIGQRRAPSSLSRVWVLPAAAVATVALALGAITLLEPPAREAAAPATPLVLDETADEGCSHAGDQGPLRGRPPALHPVQVEHLRVIDR